jgi:uncharacterized protein (TIGR03089 family)
VTFYDLTTAERTELSGLALMNWVAKTAGMLVEAADLEPGDYLRIGVGTHWTEIIMILASWTAGVVVTDGEGADAAFVGPNLAASEPLGIASALHPLGTRFSEPLPSGFIDFGAEVWSYPDVFVGPPLAATDIATSFDGRESTHADLLTTDPDSRRLLVTGGNLERDTRLLTSLALGGGSLVIVHGGDRANLERIATQEHADIA